MHQIFKRILTLPVIVCTLGYAIDLYDLLVFSAVRIQSMTAIGVPAANQLDAGISLINAQMLGLVLGGIVFGILGDKFGRTKILFSSICLYSIATFANAFVTDLPTYKLLRFVSGFGLSGELGLAITLIAEIIDKKDRGYAAAIIAGFGMLGCVLAGVSAKYLDWRTCYMIGGTAGVVLLILRAKVIESPLFQALGKNMAQGSIKLLFSSFDRIKRFLLCILIAVPMPLTFWMLIAFAPEFTSKLGLAKPLTSGDAIVFGYIGLTLGDLFSCFLTQMIKSRRKVLLLFVISNFALCLYYLSVHHDNSAAFKILYVLLGFSGGYWALMALIAAESFGTNLRATVATTVPNFARAAAIPIGIALSMLKGPFGLIQAATTISIFTFAIGIVAALVIKETYDTGIDYIES